MSIENDRTGSGNRRANIRRAALLPVLLLLLFAPRLACAAEAPQPGDACTTAGQRVLTGGSTQPNGNFLVCDGATWNLFFGYSTAGKSLFEIDYYGGSCTAAYTGRWRYVGGSFPWEYCNGVAWVPLNGGPVCTNDTAAACYLEAARSADDADFIAGNIRNGTNILGVTGTLVLGSDPTCTNDSTARCTLAATRSSGDPDFVAANIRQGVDVLGVTGTYAGTGGGYSPLQGSRIETSFKNSCAIRTDGTAWCWGSQSIGDGYQYAETEFEPAPVFGGYTWSALAPEGSWSSTVCAIRASNQYPYCWGTAPTLVNPVAVSAIATGYSSGCYIQQSDSTLWCWGYNSYGDLGDGTTTNRTTPVQVSNAGPWSAIAMHHYHTCAIKTSDGTLWCWGYNSYGQLGNGTSDSSAHPNPVQVSDAGPWQSVSVGYYDTCAIKTAGTLWCWGANPDGQLGNGTADGNNGIPHANPVQISDAGPWSKVAAAGEDYYGHGVVCAIKTNGTLWCWGYGADGALGNTSFADQHTPVQVSDSGMWTDVAADYNHVCGIKTGGAVRCWGSTAYGQLGIPGSELNQHDVAAALDFTPNAFNFPDNSGAARSMWITSSILQITGLTGDPMVTVSGGFGSWDGEFRICNLADCSDVSSFSNSVQRINNNQYLQLEDYSSGSYSTANPAVTINVGNVSDTWTVTTGSADMGTFYDLTNQMTGALVSTGIPQVYAGSPSTQTVSIAGGGSPQFRICSDWQCSTIVVNWTTTPSSLTIGQYLQLRMTTSASTSTQLTATVTVGTSQASWSTTTGATPPKRVFITSTTYTGATVAGVAGANTACAARATAAGFAGTYKAWVAVTTGTDAPASTFTQATVPYELPNGTVIANNWTGLVSGTLLAGITMDETYASWGQTAVVWTNVATNGTATTSGSSNTGNCTAWTSAQSARSGNAALSGYTTATWTAWGTQACNTSNHLLCFQQ